MKKCPSCASTVNDSDQFCTACGCKMPADDMCAACGTRLLPGAAFCIECGYPVRHQRPSSPDTPPPPPEPPVAMPDDDSGSKRKTFGVVEVVAIVLAVAATGVLIWLWSNKNRDYTPPQPPAYTDVEPSVEVTQPQPEEPVTPEEPEIKPGTRMLYEVSGDVESITWTKIYEWDYNPEQHQFSPSPDPWDKSIYKVEFDQLGRLTNYQTTYYCGEYPPSYRITYSDNAAQVTSYDDTQRQIYCDSQGRIVRFIEAWEDEGYLERTEKTYSWTSDGRISEYKISWRNIDTIYSYSYDIEGRLVCENGIMGSGKTTKYTYVSFDSHNNWTERIATECVPESEIVLGCYDEIDHDKTYYRMCKETRTINYR